MIMKCCGQFSGYCQRSCQRNSSDVIVGGLSKLKSKQDIRKIVNDVFGNNPIRNILRDVLWNNRTKKCQDIVNIMIKDNNTLPSNNADELYTRIAYSVIIKEIQETLKPDTLIIKDELIKTLEKAKQLILSELLEEQKCIKIYEEYFKTAFPMANFDDFINCSDKDFVYMLSKYCELEIALNDPNIIAEQLNLKWFARNFIKKQSKTSDDNIYNDDDDAFLLYYLNEVNKDK